MITAKLNVSKIDKAHLFAGKNGKYLDIVLFQNKAGVDQYGNDGFVTQGISKEARDRGEKGAIIGNWKVVEPKGQQRPTVSTKPAADPLNGPPIEDDEPSVPF